MSNKLKKAMLALGLILFGVCNVSNFGAESDLQVETYTVKSGDTFWDVTRYYRDKDARNLYIFEYQDEVRRLNPHIADNQCQLKPGDVITLHYVKK